MDEYGIILIARAFILFLGAFLCFIGGYRGISYVGRNRASEIGAFIVLLSKSVILLGLVMLLIAIGNGLVYFIGDAWTYAFLVSAGLVGIASIAMFLLSFIRIYRYVVME